MKPLVIYHANCADGFGAAFAAWLKFGGEAEYLPMQYLKNTDGVAEFNAALPDTDITGREVYILDFSLPKPVMEFLFQYASQVVWLDHHKTAFEMWCGGYSRGDKFEAGALPNGQLIVLDDNRSGALIAWEYFHPSLEAPMLFKHIDDYDRWQFKLKGTKEFNKALWSYAPWSFEQWKHWHGTFHNALGEGTVNLHMFRTEGAAILRAHNQNVQGVVERAAMECRIEFNEQTLPSDDQPEPIRFYEFRTGLAANCPAHLSSDVGHQLATQSGTFGLLWSFKDGKVLCSLRSNGDYDVSAIAKAFGGGGHKNAAGFETDIDTLMGWLK